MTTYIELVLPAKLMELLASGVWPSEERDLQRQNLEQIVSLEAVRRVAPDENALVLFPPPFETIATRIERGELFWTWPEAAPSQIDPEKTLLIGDFGLVSDTGLVLDYRETGEPKVLRLRWHFPNPEENNKWEQVSPTLADFCKAIGL